MRKRLSRLQHIVGIGVDRMATIADTSRTDLLRLENLEVDIPPDRDAVLRTQRAAGFDADNSYLPFVGHRCLRDLAAVFPDVGSTMLMTNLGVNQRKRARKTRANKTTASSEAAVNTFRFWNGDTTRSIRPVGRPPSLAVGTYSDFARLVGCCSTIDEENECFDQSLLRFRSALCWLVVVVPVAGTGRIRAVRRGATIPAVQILSFRERQ